MAKRKTGMYVGILGVAVLVLLLGACGSSEDPTATPRPAGQPTAMPQATSTPVPTVMTGPMKGGILQAWYDTNPGSLDVLQTTTAPDMEYSQHIYDYLMHLSPRIVLEPMQAASWEVGSDNRSIVFTLVDGIVFHDGTPFDAAAVKNHLDFVRDEENLFEQRGTITAISSIDVIDNLTFKVNLSKLDALVLPNLAQRPGQIYSPTARDSTPKEVRHTNPVGAGCFKFIEWISDSHVTFERHDKCFGSAQGLPYLDGIKTNIIGDSAVALAAFRAGDIDIYVPDADQFVQLEGERGITLFEANAPDAPFFHMNVNFPPFDDVRVRRAMNMAFDRGAVISAILDDRGFPLYGPIPRAHAWCFDENYKPYDYDIAAGKALVADAGYADGVTTGPIVFWGKQGALPRLELYRDMFQDVGVTLDLNVIESIQASRGYRIDKKYAGYASAWSGTIDIDRIFRDFYDSTSSSFVGPEGGWPGVDEALAKAVSTIDPAERCTHYTEAQRLIVEEHAAAVYAYNSITTIAYRDYVIGYDPFPENGFQNYYEVSLDK